MESKSSAIGGNSKIVVFVALILLLSSYVLYSSLNTPITSFGAGAVKYWGGPDYDRGSGIASDRFGNLYVTGTSSSYGVPDGQLFVVKTNSTGEQWAARWVSVGASIGHGLACDLNGNIYVAGYEYGNALMLKLAPNGSLLWAKGWSGVGSADAYDVAIDQSGNAIFSGLTAKPGAVASAFLVGVSPTGNLLWQAIWGGASNNGSMGVTVDSSDDIYVTGYVGDQYHYSDLFLFKFNSTGQIQWQKTWGGNFTQSGDDVSVSPSGSVYVTGSESVGSARLVLLKFDSTGALLWQRILGASGDVNTMIGTGVAVGSSGDVNLVGSIQLQSDGPTGILLARFSPQGSLDYAKSWGGSLDDAGAGITMDSQGDAISVGTVGNYSTRALISLGLPVSTRDGQMSFASGNSNFLISAGQSSVHPLNGTFSFVSMADSKGGSADIVILDSGLILQSMGNNVLLPLVVGDGAIIGVAALILMRNRRAVQP